MYKKTITYTDYNNEERTEDFYFNLNETEIATLELTTEGGLGERIRRIIAAKDKGQLIKLFQGLIMKSYGVKSDDGRRFEKSEELSRQFTQTEAYNLLFLELASDEKSAIEFVTGIVPANMRESLNDAPANIANLTV